jgi:hypothetical protein
MGKRHGRGLSPSPERKLPSQVRLEEKEFNEIARLCQSNPDAAVTQFSRLVASSNESDRRTAAVCIDLLMPVRREEALRLWHLLLCDPEEEVRELANEMLCNTEDRGEFHPSPNNIQLNTNERYALSWAYYETEVNTTGVSLGDEPVPAPSDYMPGEKMKAGGWHDALLMKEVMGLGTAKGTFRERFESACKLARVSERYLLKHKSRLLSALAEQLYLRLNKSSGFDGRANYA